MTALRKPKSPSKFQSYADLAAIRANYYRTPNGQEYVADEVDTLLTYKGNFLLETPCVFPTDAHLEPSPLGTSPQTLVSAATLTLAAASNSFMDDSNPLLDYWDLLSLQISDDVQERFA
jgi:hypothetical protein